MLSAEAIEGGSVLMQAVLELGRSPFSQQQKAGVGAKAGIFQVCSDGDKEIERQALTGLMGSSKRRKEGVSEEWRG